MSHFSRPHNKTYLVQSQQRLDLLTGESRDAILEEDRRIEAADTLENTSLRKESQKYLDWTQNLLEEGGIGPDPGDDLGEEPSRIRFVVRLAVAVEMVVEAVLDGRKQRFSYFCGPAMKN